MGVILDRTQNHGTAPVRASRYFVLYVGQVSWFVLGFYLMTKAYWPSSCRPDDIVEIYSCSSLLADQRGWVESALMTWLWATPILIALEVSRRINKPAA